MSEVQLISHWERQLKFHRKVKELKWNNYNLSTSDNGCFPFVVFHKG